MDPFYIPAPVRRCVDCLKRLARLNPHERCFACQAVAARLAKPLLPARADKTPRRKPELIVSRRAGGRRKPRIPDDLRREIVAAAASAPFGEVAARFGVSASSVGNIVGRAERPVLCPRGCGETVHKGVCSGNPNRINCMNLKRKARRA